jgi:hypothetical protein
MGDASIAAACGAVVARLTAQLAERDRVQREAEGTPIPQPERVPERLGKEPLTAAVSRALVEAKVPGRMESVDCAEYPCIVFGRLESDEEDFERVERAKALVPYGGDILTTLLWAATDERYQQQRAPGAPSRERALFAMAFYLQEDRARLGDDLDRRIRVRTAELWNVLRPDDE